LELKGNLNMLNISTVKKPKQNDKANYSVIISSVKMEHTLKSCIGNGTFELRYGTSSTMEKRQSTRALQQGI
jgi:hypothetical protein